MLALYRSGRQPEALRSFQAYRSILVDELGLEPSPALVDLERRIATRSPDEEQEDSNRRLRGYRLHEELGSGAFAVVHRATQPGVERNVAIKVIREELANQPEFVRRFETEAQLVAKIEHPYIVPLYDYWREPGAAYLVMRMLPGGPLDRFVSAAPLLIQDARRMATQISAALSTAHRVGVVHRDVKPANVLLLSLIHI